MIKHITRQAFENDFGFKLLLNEKADANAPYSEQMSAILNDQAFEAARSTISAWPGYRVTPLHRLATLARRADVGEIYYKDESERFGLGSFKALGGAYAVARQLMRVIGQHADAPVTAQSLATGEHKAITEDVTVCCATDGNHGRSVAWGAQAFGCRCVIFIHATVSEARKAAIEHYGATVIRTSGNYDQSVAEAQRRADQEGWIVVSDTSYPGYTDIPKDVMQGYELMAAEALAVIDRPPTHVFLQTGVGGMAAAVAAHCLRHYGANCPKIVLADPALAACWYDTLRVGSPAAVEGDLDTIMAGLACGEVSLLAWQILEKLAAAVVVIDDQVAIDCMRMLAQLDDPEPIVAGESAVAGLGALLAVAKDKEARQLLDLQPDSRILVFGTEGDTDAALYTQLVGKPASEVKHKGSVP